MAKTRSEISSPSDTYFSRVAKEWDSIREGYFTQAIRDVAIAKANLKTGAVVADIGVGTGFMAAGLVESAATVYGVDSSQEMLDVALINLADHPNVILVHAEGANIPLPDACLDGAFANMYLHHVTDPQAAILEIARLLKPGGVVVITDMDKHTHEWARETMADVWLGFGPEQMKSWLEQAGFMDAEVTCADQSCHCDSPAGEQIGFTIFIASGRKQGS